jgi:hypothetical protein
LLIAQGLSFSIANDSIDLPRKVGGTTAIATTHVTDLGKLVKRCRAYYLSASLELDTDGKCTMR